MARASYRSKPGGSEQPQLNGISGPGAPPTNYGTPGAPKHVLQGIREGLGRIPVLGGLFDNPFTQALTSFGDTQGQNFLNTIDPGHADYGNPADNPTFGGPAGGAITRGSPEYTTLAAAWEQAGGNPAEFEQMVADGTPAYQIQSNVSMLGKQHGLMGQNDTAYQNALGTFAPLDAASQRLHGVATDPNKALTDSEFGARYSTGKAALDSLVNTGRMNSREAEASHTGGALTGRGLALNTGYDIAAQQGKAQLSSSLMGEAGQRGDALDQYIQGGKAAAESEHNRIGQSVGGSYTYDPAANYEAMVTRNQAIAGNNAQGVGNAVSAGTGIFNTAQNGVNQFRDMAAPVLTGIIGRKGGQMFGAARTKGAPAGLPQAKLG